MIDIFLQSGNVIQGVAGVITTSICGGRRPVKYPIPMQIKIWVWRKLSGLLYMNLGSALPFACMHTQNLLSLTSSFMWSVCVAFLQQQQWIKWCKKQKYQTYFHLCKLIFVNVCFLNLTFQCIFQKSYCQYSRVFRTACANVTDRFLVMLPGYFLQPSNWSLKLWSYIPLYIFLLLRAPCLTVAWQMRMHSCLQTRLF